MWTDPDRLICRFVHICKRTFKSKTSFFYTARCIDSKLKIPVLKQKCYPTNHSKYYIMNITFRPEWFKEPQDDIYMQIIIPNWSLMRFKLCRLLQKMVIREVKLKNSRQWKPKNVLKTEIKNYCMGTVF